MAKQVNVNVRTPKADKGRFYTACKKNRAVPSDVLRRLMSDYATGKISYEVTTGEL